MRNLFLGLSVCVFFPAMAQKNHAEIMKPIHQLFTAMEKGDSAMAASLFTADGLLNTITTDAAGNVKRSTSPAAEIPASFAKPKNEVYTEPIWNERIEVDGDFASVWVDYAFYRDKTFSHCGVDAFHLMRTLEGWKIFLVTDTRRTTDCEIPEDIRNRYKN